MVRTTSSNSRSTLLALVLTSTSLIAVAPSAFAATATTPTNFTYQDRPGAAGGGIGDCLIRADFDVTGTITDGTTSGGQNFDLFSVTVSDSPTALGFSAFGSSSVNVSTTQSFVPGPGTGVTETSVSARQPNALYYQIIDSTQGSSSGPVLSSGQLDMTNMRAAGGTCSAIANIVSPQVNNPPMADAGPDQTVNNYVDNTDINLTAAASTDPDAGATLTYSWVIVNNNLPTGTTTQLLDANTVTPRFRAAGLAGRNGTVEFEVTASDGQASDTDRIVVNLAGANAAPIANAGPDQNLNNFLNGTAVTLDGTGSTDPDGNSLTYQWTQISGPATTLSSPTSAQPTFTPQNLYTQTTYEFALVVNDGITSSQTTDTVLITVDPILATATPPMNIRFSQPGGGRCVVTGDFDFAGAVNDSGGNLDAYQLRITDGNDNNRLDNGAIGTGPVGTTVSRTSSADIRPATAANGAPGSTLFLNVFDRNAPGYPRLSRTPIDLAAMAAGPITCQDAALAFTGGNRPVANAGPDRAISVSVGQTITLDGTGSSDADGDPLTYQWAQFDGPAVTLSSNTAAQPTFTIPSFAGTRDFRFTLRVNDGTFTSTTDDVRLTLTSTGNRIPTANAGPDQTIAAYTSGSAVTLDGTASSDPDNNALSYLWVQTGGPSVSLSDPTLAQPTFSVTGLTAQTAYTFELVVNDGTISSTADSVVVTLSPSANNAPIADAGPDQTVASYTNGDTITLDGTGSSDPDGDPLTYQWVQTAGPAVTLSDPTDAQPEFNIANLTAQTSYTFELVVNDGSVSSVADTVTIDLTPAIVNTAPVADAGPDQTVASYTNGDTITLDGTGSSDPDGDPLTYQWVQTAGPTITLTNATDSQPTFSVTNLTAQSSYTFELVVNDGSVSSTADSVTIDLTPAIVNTAPVADAGPDQTVASYTNGDTITLDGTGSSDSDGDPLTYQWVQTAGPAVTLSDPTDAQPEFNVSNLTAQTSYTFELVVNDGATSSISDSVVIDLTPAAVVNMNPVANAGPDQTVVSYVDGTLITLDGTGSSDPEGDPLTYQWVQAGGPAVTLSDPTSVQPTFSVTGLTAQTAYAFDLTVSDGSLSSVGDRVIIDLTPAVVANSAPTADAGPDQTLNNYTDNQTINLDASASTDPDPGTSLTYSWAIVTNNLPSGATTQLLDANTVTPRFRAANLNGQNGTVELEVTVSDGQATDTDRVVLTINGAVANGVPVADAGPDQTVASYVNGSTITLDGTGSTDPDGDPLTYQWVQTSGPSVTLSDATLAQPTFNIAALSAQTAYSFELVVSDGSVSSVADSVVINLSPANIAPTANAGPDQQDTAYISTTVITLDGSGSSDPDANTTLTYQWTQISGPTVSLSDPSIAQPTFSLPTAGLSGLQSLIFELVVSDGQVSSAPDRVEVGLTPARATATTPTGLSFAANGQFCSVNATFDVTGATDDGNGQDQYEVRITDGNDANRLDQGDSDQVAIGVTETAALDARLRQTTARNAASGATLFYTVFDLDANGGRTSLSRTAIDLNQMAAAGGACQAAAADVPGTNLTPIANAGTDQTDTNYISNSAVALNGSASFDADGDTLSYQWTQTSGPAIVFSDPTIAEPTFSLDTTNLTGEQILTFDLVVNDGVEDSATETVTIRLTPGQNTAPTADAGQNITGIDEGRVVSLNGLGSRDADGDTLTYQWTQISGPSVTLSDPTSAQPSFTVPNISSAAMLVFELVVSDGVLTSSPDQVSVGVRPTGSITLISQVTGGDVTVPFSATLAALSGPLQSQNGRGQRTASDVTTGVYTITAADIRAEGYAFTDIQCDDDSVTNLATREATIDLAAGEDVTCTFSSVNSRGAAQQAITQGLVQRNRLLLSHEPDRMRRINRVKGQSGRASGVNLGGFQVASGSAVPLNVQLTDRGGQVSGSLSQSKGKDFKSDKGSVDIWGEARLSQFDSLGKDGTFSTFYVGADYLVHDNVLIGALVQHDDFSAESDDRIGDMKGKGFMVGPYVTAEINDRLYVDGRIAWGQSDNEVNPLGTFEDEFETDRFLVSGSVSGDFTVDEKVRITPTVALRHISETQKDYVDSLGVTIPELTVSQGELSFAPRFETQYQFNNGWQVSPFASVEGILSFGDEVESVFSETLRARIEAGAMWSSETGVNAGLSVFADGVGSDEFNSQGLRVSLSYQMK